MKYIGSFSVDSVESLRKCSDLLARFLTPGLMIGFSGPLGVGKTEFVRQLLRSLGISSSVPSPTFVLETQYEISRFEQNSVLYHWDLYRLSGDQVPEDIIDRRRDSRAITCIEWPEQIPEVLNLLDMKMMIDFEASNASSSEEAVSRRVIRLFCADEISCQNVKSESIAKSFFDEVSVLSL